jgi:glycosyltransferase involved in cell wall biosynthesis
MIRTLQVVVDCPWPARSGGHIRNLAIARSALAAGPVHMVSFGASDGRQMIPDISTASLPSFRGVVPWHRHDSIIRTTINLDDEDLTFLEAEIERFKPDVAVVEGSTVARSLPIIKAARVPIVMDMHNIESDLFRSLRRGSSKCKYIKDMLYGARRWKAIQEFDREISLTANETWVTSSIDRDRLVEIGGSEAIVVPNPIPNERFADLPILPDRYAEPRALFVGHLSYPPNVAAAQELAGTIWPEIMRRIGDARLTICGRTPGSSVTRLGRMAGIEVLADPEDLGPFYGRSGYALMPLRQGGGTRIKALEAMAAGTAVIATRKAVEGLGLLPEEHYLCADTPGEFAGQFIRGCAAPDEICALAVRARRFVLENYSTKALVRQIGARLAAVARSGAAADLVVSR